MSRTIASVVMLVATTAFVGTCTSASPTAGDNDGPTLSILSPKDGDTITPPTAVRYEVTGMTASQGRERVIVFMRDVADSPRVTLEPGDQPGLAYLPSDKLLTGRRDLTFVLARPDGTLLENPEARATVYRVTIEGRR
jgi:hypothetical protein